MSSDVKPQVHFHASEELLEEYSFGRIQEPDLGPLEEHLLFCVQCQSSLLAIEQYTALMKAGLAGIEGELQPRLDRSPGFALPRMPGVNILLAAAILLMFVGSVLAWRMLPRPEAGSQFASIKLLALRGGGGEGVARAPSGQRLDLVIDRTDLPATVAYRMEVVSSSGRPVWSGAAQVADQNISAHVTSPLRAGVYWVRLYSSGNQLRREFGLHIE